MPEDEIYRLTLPPGRHRLPRDFVERHQRNRLFAAIVGLVDQQGYPATSLTQIVKRAGIARHTFYEHFEDKESLFLSVFDTAAERVIKATQQAAEAQSGPWEEQMRAAIAALLAEVAKDPALARVCLTEVVSASLTTLAHYEAVMGRFATLLRTGRENLAPGTTLPSSLEDVVVGGVAWMLIRRLSSDPESIEVLLPEILEFVLIPYLGEAAAHKAAQACG